MPREEKRKPAYRHPESEEELISGIEVRKADEPDEGETIEPAEEADEGAEAPDGVVISLSAPNIEGDYAVFVSLPDGLLIVEEYEGESDLTVFADAIERRLAVPYRAQAVRANESRFIVVASEILTVELPGLDGEELIVVVAPDGERCAVLDGVRIELDRPELDEVIDESAPCLLRVVNVDEAVWEIKAEIL